MSTVWTQFMDMHSGGGLKHGAAHIYIEAPEDEARVVFYHLFGTNPERVSCTCCGEDYSITESPSLALASAFERGCAYIYRRPDGTECPREEAWVIGKGIMKGYVGGYEERESSELWHRPYLTLAEYLMRKDIKVVYAGAILPEHRGGAIPEQGYVWRD